MRFIEYPASAFVGGEHSYMVRVTEDEGLYTLAARLGVRLYTKGQISALKAPSLSPEGHPSTPKALVERQSIEERRHWIKVLEERPLKAGELIAVANNFGTAELLMVRDTFKMPLMIVLYTLLVLATCFHAFNGLWTFMISWGVALTRRAQDLMWAVSVFLMALVGGLGLSAVWLTYWVNLKS